MIDMPPFFLDALWDNWGVSPYGHPQCIVMKLNKTLSTSANISFCTSQMPTFEKILPGQVKDKWQQNVNALLDVFAEAADCATYNGGHRSGEKIVCITVLSVYTELTHSILSLSMVFVGTWMRAVRRNLKM